MTNKQINIAIALSRGWTDCVFVESLKLTKGFPPPNNPPIYGTYENGMAQLPDYCNDLNVIHGAVMTLPENKRILYGMYLASICGHMTKKTVGLWHISIATARHRAEAFLKTIGKWEEA
jgi:hypothetical protein